MKLLKSRLLKNHKGSWIVETDECCIFLSKSQVSGFLNTTAPFYTYAYWDDPLILAKLQASPRPLLVLGSGILSYLPQLRSHFPELSITHVEFDQEIFEESKRIALKQNIGNHCDTFINSDGYSVDFKNFEGYNFFVDIYTDKGIHPGSLDEEFLRSLARFSDIAAFNVFDTRYPAAGSSTLFQTKLEKHFSEVVFLKRENSNTIFCSNKVKDLLGSLTSVLNSDENLRDLNCVAPPPAQEEPWPEDVLTFSSSDIEKKHSTGPFLKIQTFFNSLGPYDLIKSTRGRR